LFDFIGCDARTIVEPQLIEIRLEKKLESIVIKGPIPRNDLADLGISVDIPCLRYFIHVDSANIPKRLNIVNVPRNNLPSVYHAPEPGGGHLDTSILQLPNPIFLALQNHLSSPLPNLHSLSFRRSTDFLCLFHSPAFMTQ
jgi:hypothetical protein